MTHFSLSDSVLVLNYLTMMCLGEALFVVHLLYFAFLELLRCLDQYFSSMLEGFQHDVFIYLLSPLLPCVGVCGLLLPGVRSPWLGAGKRDPIFWPQPPEWHFHHAEHTGARRGWCIMELHCFYGGLAESLSKRFHICCVPLRIFPETMNSYF